MFTRIDTTGDSPARPRQTTHRLRSRSRTPTAPTAANSPIKRVKRVAIGFRRFANYRTRALLHAGKPNWDLLASVTPR